MSTEHKINASVWLKVSFPLQKYIVSSRKDTTNKTMCIGSCKRQQANFDFNSQKSCDMNTVNFTQDARVYRAEHSLLFAGLLIYFFSRCTCRWEKCICLQSIMWANRYTAMHEFVWERHIRVWHLGKGTTANFTQVALKKMPEMMHLLYFSAF